MRIAKNIFLGLGLILASSSMAEDLKGSIVLVGKGVASSEPEYLSLSVKISSICYETSQDAQAANAKMSMRILDILQGFKKDNRDKLTATGGANYRQTETIQVGIESKVLCELKWRSENTLNLSMVKMDDLPLLQDQLFTELNQSANVNPEQAEQTYAEVSRPSFGLFPETTTSLRNSAQSLALSDAKAQFAGLNAQCAFVDPKIVSIVPPEFNYAVKSAPDRVAASYYSPVIPDAMEVQATLRIEWKFTPNSACKR
jgi:uncharacterized protein YggE